MHVQGLPEAQPRDAIAAVEMLQRAIPDVDPDAIHRVTRVCEGVLERDLGAVQLMCRDVGAGDSDELGCRRLREQCAGNAKQVDGVNQCVTRNRNTVWL